MSKYIKDIKDWCQDVIDIGARELKLIFKDGGVLLIFFVAGLLYPILYNVVYMNGVLEDTPVAIVDEANCAESRRFVREVDATREVKVAFKCADMEEARSLLEKRKVNGIYYFPSDFGEKLARMETATVSVYCDMSSFLYYKNALMAANLVMLSELRTIQEERYCAAGFTGQEASQLVQAVPYEENNPYNPTFSYSIFILAAILFVIIQQTMFYGMTLLAGTLREQKRSFALMNGTPSAEGIMKTVIGRGWSYWLIYLGIGIYVSFIVPAIFGMPLRGSFLEILLLIQLYVTDCVYFCMTWSTFINKRETVFVLFLFLSPICLFLGGSSWPTSAFPAFWKAFSYIFPSTFGSQAYINLSSAGGNLTAAQSQMSGLLIQTVFYFVCACTAVYAENRQLRKELQLQERTESIG